MKYEYGAFVEWCCKGNTEVLDGKPIPVPLYSTINPTKIGQ
jgi:hypothetical protein